MAKLSDREIKDLWNSQDDSEYLHEEIQDKKLRRGSNNSAAGKISSKEHKIAKDLMKTDEDVGYYQYGKGKKPR